MMWDLVPDGDDLGLIPSRNEVNASSSPATGWVAWEHILGSQWYDSLVLRQGERGGEGRIKMVTIKSGEGIRLRGHRPRIFLLVSSRLCGIDFLSENS